MDAGQERHLRFMAERREGHDGEVARAALAEIEQLRARVAELEAVDRAARKVVLYWEDDSLIDLAFDELREIVGKA